MFFEKMYVCSVTRSSNRIFPFFSFLESSEQTTESTPRIKAKRRDVKNSTKIKGKESIGGIIFDGGSISPILESMSEKTPLKTPIPSRKSCTVNTDKPQLGPIKRHARCEVHWQIFRFENMHFQIENEGNLRGTELKT